ncbi:hypothetical protein CEXT_496821 [Caerostris extrusa]|uniref:Uncharacterized protein n=1 Tax=Caerostris extrusa TaxID=172846 RepID=A0AAV4RT41_CAEEX|nr:hypothetical protein CEXT_496821 [Caerostris extrusa]
MNQNIYHISLRLRTGIRFHTESEQSLPGNYVMSLTNYSPMYERQRFRMNESQRSNGGWEHHRLPSFARAHSSRQKMHGHRFALKHRLFISQFPSRPEDGGNTSV